MEQTSNITLLSRPQLKDKARGTLMGKYGKSILALFLVSLLGICIQAAVEFFASMLLSSYIVLKETAINQVPLEQVEILVSSTEYMQSYMTWFRPVDYILLALTSVFTTVFKVGISYFFLNIACGGTARVADIFYGFKNQFSKCLKLSAVFVLVSQLVDIPNATISYLDPNVPLSTTQLIILFAALVMGFILYTIIYLGISQSFFLILDFPNYSAMELLKLSMRIMKGHKLRFLLLELSFIPLMLLSLLTFGIGNLWLNPYMQLTYTYFFLNLMQTRNTQAN